MQDVFEAQCRCGLQDGAGRALMNLRITSRYLPFHSAHLQQHAPQRPRHTLPVVWIKTEFGASN